MPYTLLILRRAQKELSRIPRETFSRICEQMRDLPRNPRPRGAQKLRGRAGMRLRVGAYRVIYEIDTSSRQITILHVGHRRDVYK